MPKNNTAADPAARVPEAEQPYPVPKNWVWVKLGNIAPIITKGATPTTYGYAFETEGIRFVKIENIQGEKIIHGSITSFISQEANDFQKRSQLQAGDLLFSIAGTIGEVCVVTEDDLPANINQALAIIRGFDKYVSSNFLGFLFISFVADTVKAKARGGTLNNISLGDLKQFLIPVPPLAEQRRIVAKLDALLGKLRAARDLLDAARDSFALRRAAILHKAFSGQLTAAWRKEHPDLARPEFEEYQEQPYKIPASWKWVELGKTCQLKHGFAFKKEDYCDVGIPIIRISDIIDGEVVTKHAQTVPDHLYNERFQIKTGDLLIALSGATTGKNGIYYGEKFIMQNQRVGNLKITDPQAILEGYRNFFIRNSQMAILKLAYGGAQPNINADLIEGLPLPLAPLEEQREIVRRLDALLTHEAEAAALLDMDERLDLLEQSILARAFRSELGTRDPADAPALAVQA